MRNIIKYNSRKLYDKTTKAYTTLKKLRSLVANGETISVAEKNTGKDITNNILFQALSSNDFTNEQLINLLKGNNNEKTSTNNA